jgi:hypothetical protein
MFLQNEKTFDEFWKTLIACYEETDLIPIVTTLLKLKQYCPQNNSQPYSVQLLGLKVSLQQFPDFSVIIPEVLELVMETHLKTLTTTNANELVEEILHRYLDVTNRKNKLVLLDTLAKIVEKCPLSQESSAALLCKIAPEDIYINSRSANSMKMIVVRLLNFIEQPEVLFENLPKILAIMGQRYTKDIIMFVEFDFVVLKLFISCCITDL